ESAAALHQAQGIAVLLIARTLELRALRAIYAGSAPHLGVLLRRESLDTADLARALTEVARGIVVATPSLLEHLVSDNRTSRVELLRRLTAREREVLELMAEGARNGVIAARLGRSERLVEKCVTAVFEKLELPRGERFDRRVKACRILLLAGSPDTAEDTD